MPVYEFKCPNCENTAEVRCPYERLIPPWCSECDLEMERMYSTLKPIFKGSGFYETDYKD